MMKKEQGNVILLLLIICLVIGLFVFYQMAKNHIKGSDTALDGNKEVKLESILKDSLNNDLSKAGRGKGAIKGNSPEILQLREKIIKAKMAQKELPLAKTPQYQITQAIRIKNNYRKRYKELKYEYDAQANQILSLLSELADTQLELKIILQKLKNVHNFKN